MKKSTNSMLVLSTMLLTVPDCDEEGAMEQDEFRVSQLEEQGDRAELSRVDADRLFFAERKRKYRNRGVVPQVPPSLSDDPHDPEFEFRGYIKIHNNKHSASRASNRPVRTMTAEERAFDRLPAEKNRGGLVFTNDSGESWLWRPKNAEARLQQIRAKRGTPGMRYARSSAFVPEEVERGGKAGEEISFRSIIGTDGRSLRSGWNGYNLTAFPWHSIGSLETDGKDITQTPEAQCTASKVGPRHLLTSAHCVFEEGGGEESLKPRDWWPGADGINRAFGAPASAPNGRKNIEWYVVDEYYIDEGWDSRDFAVLVLYDFPSSCNFQNFGYSVYSSSNLRHEDFWNFGHPRRQKTCPDISPIDRNKCHGSMWGEEAEVDSVSTSYLYHEHDVQGGQSGSPIYDYNGGDRQIVGIHKGDWTQSKNRAIRMRDLVHDFIDLVRDEKPSVLCPD